MNEYKITVNEHEVTNRKKYIDIFKTLCSGIVDIYSVYSEKQKDIVQLVNSIFTTTENINTLLSAASSNLQYYLLQERLFRQVDDVDIIKIEQNDKDVILENTYYDKNKYSLTYTENLVTIKSLSSIQLEPDTFYIGNKLNPAGAIQHDDINDTLDNNIDTYVRIEGISSGIYYDDFIHRTIEEKLGSRNIVTSYMSTDYDLIRNVEPLNLEKFDIIIKLNETITANSISIIVDNTNIYNNSNIYIEQGSALILCNNINIDTHNNKITATFDKNYSFDKIYISNILTSKIDINEHLINMKVYGLWSNYEEKYFITKVIIGDIIK